MRTPFVSPNPSIPPTTAGGETNDPRHGNPFYPFEPPDPVAAKRAHDEKYGTMVRRSREREAARREAESAMPAGHGAKGISHEQQEPGPGGERPDGACGASRDSDEPSPGPLAEPVPTINPTLACSSILTCSGKRGLGSRPRSGVGGLMLCWGGCWRSRTETYRREAWRKARRTPARETPSAFAADTKAIKVPMSRSLSEQSTVR